MVCAERSASCEVQLMPLCYYYVCFTLIPLAQGDYLTAKVGARGHERAYRHREVGARPDRLSPPPEGEERESTHCT